eukprot:493174-Prorocentrum_minimum.AAC.1
MVYRAQVPFDIFRRPPPSVSAPFRLRELRDDVDEAPRVAGDATGGHRVKALLAVDEKHHRVGLVRHFSHHLEFPKAKRGQEGVRGGQEGVRTLLELANFCAPSPKDKSCLLSPKLAVLLLKNSTILP